MGYIGRAPGFAIESQQITLSGDASGSITIGDGTDEVVLTVEVQDDSHSHSSYLPLSGGTISGDLTVTGTITESSDIRVKSNLEVIPNALDKVKSITGYTFNKNDEEKRSVGVIAQDVIKILPEAVMEDSDGMYSVAYGNMVGLLVEAIKELESRVKELEGR